MNIKNLIIAIAIFILTISVGVYGISTIYGKSPQYEKYCPQIINEKECITFGGNWTNYSADQVNSVPPVPQEKIGPVYGGYCDNYQKCNADFQAAREKYNKKVFLIALPLGIIVIIIGALVFGLISVGGGLMAGGVGIIIYGVGGFWEFADNWIKFVFSLIGLIIVIGLAYYINKKISKKK